MRIRATITAWDRSTWTRRIRLSGAAAASAALVASALPLWAGPADAQITTRPAVTLAGSIGTLPAASASVVVDVNVPTDLNSRGDPQRIDEVPVASATVTGPRFSIPVPTSATLQQAEQQGHGTVNFTVMAVSGSFVTAEGIPAPIDASPAAANAAQLATQAAGIVQMPAFAAFRPMTAAQKTAMRITQSAGLAVPAYPCYWNAYGSEYNDLTRIGEVHVANTYGLSDDFHFRYQNDQTITFGYTDSTGAAGGWSIGGTMSLTNTLSANGGHTFGQGSVDYADTTYYYQRYAGVGACPIKYMIQAVGTAAVVNPGTNTPPVNPYGGCRNDPYGIPFTSPGTWDYDVGRAQYYSGIATVFGFTFGGSDGFTSDVEHDYTSAPGAATTWLCGSPGDEVTNSPIVYNTT